MFRDQKCIEPISERGPELAMSRKDWCAVIGGALGAFMAILDIQITNASLREIQGALGLDFSETGWISTSYLIAEIMVIPLTAYLVKAVGMRRYVTLNCVGFMFASVFCGMSWNLKSIILFRFLQGLTGGVLIPVAFQIMLLIMPPAKKTLGLAIFGFTITLAPTLGPSLGGWLTSTCGWRCIFFINLLPGLLTIYLLRMGIPNAPMNISILKKMDIKGAVLMSIGLASLTFLLEEGAKRSWFEDFTLQCCCLISIISLTAFVWYQLKLETPLLNLRLLAQKEFGIATAITTLTAAVLYGGMYALSLYLGQVQQYGARHIGTVMVWVGIPQLFVVPCIPYLMKKVDLRILTVIGLSLFAVSNYLNLHLSSDYSGDEFRLSLIIRALGQPFFMIPLSSMAMSWITPDQVGNASAIFNVMRNLGGSIGIAITGTCLVARQQMHFARNIAHVSLYDGRTLELLSSFKNYFLAKGSDPGNALNQALSMLTNITLRESLIQAFGDAYFWMCVELGFCIVLVLFLSKVSVVGKGTSESH
jgi:DHA2 family multidrug resistance protein